jgi:hypothetical protein
MVTDLNSLSNEVLFYVNDQFYKFIENCLGVDEMNLLKVQSIKNIRTLIKVPDIFSVLSFKNKELLDLKNRLCFIDDDDNNNIIVKAGIKTSFDDLITTLKEKNNKYSKGRKNSKLSSSSSSTTNDPISNASSSSTTNDPISNASSLNTTNPNVSDSSVISTPTTVPNLMSINDYIQVICDSIDKYLINTFQNIILKHNNDYVIHLKQLDIGINGHIKCGCDSIVKLAFRLHTKSFQLSSYFKHIKNSRCVMMKKKRQETNKSSNSSNNVLQNDIFSDIEDEIIIDEENMDDSNENSQITTNTSISNDSSSFRKKRSISSSNTTKKTRTY